MNNHHEYSLHTSRSKIDINLTPSRQILQVDSGKQEVTIYTEITKGVLQFKIEQGGKVIFKSSMEHLLFLLDTIQGLGKVKHLVCLQESTGLDEASRRAYQTVKFFLDQE